MYSIDSPSASIRPIYSSNLTTNSSKFARDCIDSMYYYEAIKINVIEDGNYTLGSDSQTDMYGQLYKNKFNPFHPTADIITENNDDGCNFQFKLIHYLQKHITYILVVTTSFPYITGSFSIIAIGPNNVTAKQHIGEYTNHIDSKEFRTRISKM